MSGWKAERCGPKPEDRAPAAGAHDATQTCQHAWWRSRQSRATDGQLSVATALRYDRWAMDLIISLGEESRLALSCDLRSSLQSCCVVQGAAEHLLLGGTAMHHAPARPVATLIYGAVLAWESITWTRDRRCKKKKSQPDNCIGRASFTQLMQKAMNCIKGSYSLFPDRSTAIYKRARKNNSSWLRVLMHLCSCNHSASSRL